jgi:hypothetical protein
VLHKVRVRACKVVYAVEGVGHSRRVGMCWISIMVQMWISQVTSCDGQDTLTIYVLSCIVSIGSKRCICVIVMC